MSDREFARYLSIALSSTYELICGFEIAFRLNIFSKLIYQKITSEADEIAAMITGFMKTLNKEGFAASCKLQAASLS